MPDQDKEHPISPDIVHFENVLDRLVYVQTISIRNYADKARRVRIAGPHGPANKSPFSLVYTPTTSLAPGLECVCDVHFVLPDPDKAVASALETGIYRDRLVVTFGDNEQRMEIPLTASTPQGRIMAVPTAPKRHRVAGRDVQVVPAPGAPGLFHCRLGDVALNAPARVEIELRNFGPVAADFELEAISADDAGEPLVVEPKQGRLGPDRRAARDLARLAARRPAPARGADDDDDDSEPPSSREATPGDSKLSVATKIKLIVPTGAAGVQRFRVNVKSRQPLPCALDVSAVVAPPRLELYAAEGPDAGRLLSDVDFGSMFYGQAREIKAILVNNAPTACPFVVSVASDRELAVANAKKRLEQQAADEDLGEPKEKGSDDDDDDEDEPKAREVQFRDEWAVDDGALTVTPAEGLLEPRAEQAVVFKFAPPIPPPASGFKHQIFAPMTAEDDDAHAGEAGGRQRRNVPARPYGLRVRLGAEGDEEDGKHPPVEVNVAAHAAEPHAVHATPGILRFGRCVTRKKKVGALTIENACDVAARFEFAHCPQFRVFPRVGRLAGRAQARVRVEFYPASMGNFEVVCDLKVEGGLATQQLTFRGKAVQGKREKDPNKSLIAGPGMTWDPIQQSLYGDDYLKLFSSFEGQSTILADGTVLESKYAAIEDEKLREQKQFSDANAKKYVQYLRDCTKKREGRVDRDAALRTAALSGRDPRDPKGVDLALHPLEEPPPPPLPDGFAEPLWIQKGGGRKSAAATALDANKLVQEKFKPRPTTQAEMRHCSARLSAAELAQVTPTTALLDFGRVCVGSTAVRNFGVANGLDHAVLVALSDEMPPEITGRPASQVVPPEAQCGFDMSFHCDKEMKDYRGVVQYTINDAHVLTFEVTAEVVPVRLDLDVTDLELAFDAHSLEPSVDQEVTLTNPGNSAVDFVWAPGAPFGISPEEGTIKPYGSATMLVTWTPEHGVPNAAKLHAHVPGAKADLELAVSGVLEEATCAFKQKKVDFGNAAVGAVKDFEITLENTGDVAAVCTMEIPGELSDCVTCSHDRFRLAAGQTQPMTLLLKATDPRKLDGFVVCDVRGCAPLKIKVEGTAIVPDVRIAREEISFGDEEPAPLVFDFASQFVGFECRRRVVLQNASEIPANLILDLSNHPDFDAEPCKPRDEPPPAPATQARPTFGRTPAPAPAPAPASALETSAGSSMEHVAARDDDDETVSTRRSSAPAFEHYTLTVAPHGALAFELIFAPKAPGAHDFELPLELVAGGGTFDATLKASALRPMLVLSQTTVDFGERIFTPDETRRVPFSQDVVVTNHHHGTLTWRLEVGDDVECFAVTPKEGRLVPGETTTVRAAFTPSAPKEFEARLPLEFLTEQEQEDGPMPDKPALDLVLRGAGANPRLEIEAPPTEDDFEYQRCEGDVFIMPTVPIGVTSRVLVYVRNIGFEHMTLEHEVPPTCPVTLDVQFPDGKTLSAAIPRVPIIVSFAATEPVSFATNLRLLDSDGRSYDVPLAGAADACLLSTHAFLDQYRYDWTFYMKDGRAPKLVPALLAREMMERELKEKEAARAKKRASLSGKGKKPKSLEDKPAAAPAPAAAKQKIPDGVDARKERPLPNDELAPLVCQWLNYHALSATPGPKAPLKAIPEDCYENNGKVPLDAIEALCGKKLPGRLQRTISNDRELANQLLEQYKALLLFLIERGCLLNQVRPEQLLERHHYILIRDQQAGAAPTRSIKEARHAYWDETHATVAHEAWLSVLLQTIRVFALQRLTPKAFASLPGVLVAKPPERKDDDDASRKSSRSNKSQADPEMGGSNVYSVGECVLLKWFSYHSGNGTGAPAGLGKRYNTFGKAFGDGAAVCGCVASNAAHLVESGGALANLKTLLEPQNDDEKGELQKMAAEALVKLRCDLGEAGADEDMIEALGAEDFPHLDGARGVLFCLHLYLTLPNFVPKTTIEFNATLGAALCKTIELKNSAARDIVYDVQLDGSRDFVALDSRGKPRDRAKAATVIVDAKGKGDYAVELLPRFSAPVGGRVTFFAKPCDRPGLRAPALVFGLQSRVESHKACGFARVEATCYEPKTFDVPIATPFKEQGVFAVKALTCECIEAYRPARPAAKKGGPVSKKKKRVTVDAADLWLQEGRSGPVQQAAKLLQEPFHPVSKQLRVSKEGDAEFKVEVLACSPGVYKCEVRFLNEDIGEFVVEVVAKVGLPKKAESFKFALEAGADGQTSVNKLLKFSSTNPALERALGFLTERVSSNAEKALVRQALQQMSRGPPPPDDADEPVDDEPGADFTVVVDSPFFQAADSVFIAAAGGKVKGPAKAQLADVKESDPLDAPNNLLLSFYPQKAGAYAAGIVAQARPGLVHDIRTITLDAAVTVPKIPTTIEFRAPARQTIVQEIPLQNATDEDWKFTGNVQGSRAFSGPKTLEVPAGGTAHYPITYAPSWVGEEKAKLVLKQAKSSDSFEYQLEGSAEEPLAEDHVVLQCHAREPHRHIFQLKGGPKPTTYTVEADLPFVSGANEVQVPGNKTVDFPLTFTPALGGKYTGAVTFKSAQGTFIWWTVEVHVESPLADQAIDMQTVARKACSAGITLVNPLDEEIVFDVVCEGDGVSGPARFALPPAGEATYELMYAPLISKTHRGSVAFLNDRVGEFWYQLNLDATPAPPLTLAPFACAVGARVSTKVTIENPLPQEIELAGSSSGPTFVVPETTVVAPYQAVEVEVTYVPSELDADQTATVKLAHEALGEYEYVCTGRGTRPGVMDEHRPSALVGDPQSYMFNFRNPFDAPIDVDVALEEDAAYPGALQLILRRPSLRLAPRQQTAVPLAFDPRVIAEHHAVVRVETDYRGERLTWRYPVRGMVNAPVQLRAVRLACKAKTSQQREVRLRLKNLAELAPGGEDFEFEVAADDPEAGAFAKRALALKPVKLHLDSITDELRFDATFRPLRAFAGSVNLVVRRETGGRWPFEVQLEATEPDPDDTIALEASLHHTAKARFALVNSLSTNFEPFSAYFTTDSSRALAVQPTQGLLAPVGAEGTAFEVAFAPTKYSMLERGRLVVKTAETTWSYEVRGTNPPFVVPEATTKIDTHMSARYLRN